MSFFNSDIDMTYIERATLIEDIILPSLPVFPTLDAITDGTVYYPHLEELYTDTVGKFYIPILSPLDDSDSPTDTPVKSRQAKNILNANSLEVNKYMESNYVELTIPKYILLNYLEKIPQGTVFLVGFVGGSLRIQDIKIIGVN